MDPSLGCSLGEARLWKRSCRLSVTGSVRKVENQLNRASEWPFDERLCPSFRLLDQAFSITYHLRRSGMGGVGWFEGWRCEPGWKGKKENNGREMRGFIRLLYLASRSVNA